MLDFDRTIEDKLLGVHCLDPAGISADCHAALTCPAAVENFMPDEYPGTRHTSLFYGCNCFCLHLEASCLQWSFFTYSCILGVFAHSWSVFAYSLSFCLQSEFLYLQCESVSNKHLSAL